VLRKQLKLIIILQMATSIVNIFVRIEWREVIEFLPRKLSLEKKLSTLTRKRRVYFTLSCQKKELTIFLSLTVIDINQWSLHLTEKIRLRKIMIHLKIVGFCQILGEHKSYETLQKAGYSSNGQK